MSRAAVILAPSPAATLALKLYAVAAMILDHADSFLYGGDLGFHETFGRTVFPVFAYLLAINLARTPSDYMLRNVAPRMLFVGIIASPFYVSLAGWLPLNIMFTLATACVIAWAMRAWPMLALALFAVGGTVVDYGYFGLLAILLPWAILTTRFTPFWLPIAAASLALVPVNGSLWSLAAIPVIVAAVYLQGNAPRFKWAFYAVYPVHLAAFWVLSL